MGGAQPSWSGMPKSTITVDSVSVYETVCFDLARSTSTPDIQHDPSNAFSCFQTRFHASGKVPPERAVE